MINHQRRAAFAVLIDPNSWRLVVAGLSWPVPSKGEFKLWFELHLLFELDSFIQNSIELAGWNSVMQDGTLISSGYMGGSQSRRAKLVLAVLASRQNTADGTE